MTSSGRAGYGTCGSRTHGPRNRGMIRIGPAQPGRVRRPHRLPRNAHRRGFPGPTRTMPVITGPVLPEGDAGGQRLRLALDQVRHSPPTTISGWKALAEGILVDERCALHRNQQVSSCYAWAYMALPGCFKWAGMAAIASHHVRVALLPLHIETALTSSSGRIRTPGRRRVFTDDMHTIRATNNDIFDDLFWVHLAYVTSDDGIALLRALLRDERHYAPVLAGFEALDQGRRVLEDAAASPAARGNAEDLVWKGTLLLLEHEQRFVVQPNFDRLSSWYARVVTIGSATTFDSRRPRRAIETFTSFYLYSIVSKTRRRLDGRTCPLITNYDVRWRWLVSSVVPRFQRVDTDPHVIRTILRRILGQDRHYPSSPTGTAIR